MSIPYQDIRLVYPISQQSAPDMPPKQYNVIVEKMRVRIVDRGHYKELLRYIPDIELPPVIREGMSEAERKLGYPILDPAAAKDDKKSLDEEDPEILEADTQRIFTENESWEPSLEEPPFDPIILDELRNKFSKFRLRHDEEFIKGKLEADQRTLLMKQSVKLAQSPRALLLEAHSKSLKEKRKRIQPAPETLALLGKYMSEHQLKKPGPPESAESTKSS
jgi:hypothetical protein